MATIKIRVLKGSRPYLPKIIKKGDWIDLTAGEKVQLTNRGLTKISYIPLGIAMELPKGYEAILVSRSSTPEKFGITCPNSFGVIDNSYCGNEDEWKFPAIGLRQTTINSGDRICQFRIQLSQKATVWQKLKWLFSGNLKIKFVDNLSKPSRGGIGTTGTR